MSLLSESKGLTCGCYYDKKWHYCREAERLYKAFEKSMSASDRKKFDEHFKVKK